MTICWDCLGGKPVVSTLEGTRAAQTFLQTTCDVCKLRKSSYLKVLTTWTTGIPLTGC